MTRKNPGSRRVLRGARVHGRPGRTTGAGAMTEHETGPGDRAAQQAGGATARAGCPAGQRSTGEDGQGQRRGARGGHPRAGDHLRDVRGGQVDGREVPGGPRLVRRRQPAARADPHHGGARRALPGERGADRGRRRRPRPSASSTTCASPSPTSTRAGSPVARSSWSPPTTPSCAASSRCAVRTRSRATAGSSTASPPSGSAARAARRRRPGDRHLRAQRARAAREDARAVRRARRSPSCGPP